MFVYELKLATFKLPDTLSLSHAHKHTHTRAHLYSNIDMCVLLFHQHHHINNNYYCCCIDAFCCWCLYATAAACAATLQYTQTKVRTYSLSIIIHIQFSKWLPSNFSIPIRWKCEIFFLDRNSDGKKFIKTAKFQKLFSAKR